MWHGFEAQNHLKNTVLKDLVRETAKMSRKPSRKARKMNEYAYIASKKDATYWRGFYLE